MPNYNRLIKYILLPGLRFFSPCLGFIIFPLYSLMSSKMLYHPYYKSSLSSPLLPRAETSQCPRSCAVWLQISG